MIDEGCFISDDVKISSSAKIGKNVVINGKGEIHDGVEIGNGVIIEGNFSIGNNTRLDHYSIIRGNVHISENNWIYPFCTIGTGPQHRLFLESSDDKFNEQKGQIVVGSNNVIREYTTIHNPTTEKKTVVGSNCYVMAYSHIAHDCIVKDNVTMANQATLGGHVHVNDFANIGLNVAIHQFCSIGEYCMIGMGNTIVKDVLPFSTIINQKFRKINKLGLQRNNISDNDISGIEELYSNFNLLKLKNNNWYENIISNFMNNSRRSFYSPELL